MKTFFVKSIMSETGKYENRKIGTGEFKKNLIGMKKEIMKKTDVWIKTGYSDSFVDGEKTAEQLEKKFQEIEKKGLTVVSVESIISGNWNYKTGTLMNTDGSIILPNKTNAGGWGYGYGFSFTSGYIITAKK